MIIHKMPRLYQCSTKYPEALSFIYHLVWLILGIWVHKNMLESDNYIFKNKLGIHLEFVMINHTLTYPYCLQILIHSCSRNPNESFLVKLLPNLHSFITINQIVVLTFYWPFIFNKDENAWMGYQNTANALFCCGTQLFLYYEVRLSHIKNLLAFQQVFGCWRILLGLEYPETLNYICQMPWYWKFFGWMVFYMLTIMSCMIIWVVSYIKERETAKKYGQQFDRESCFKFLEFRQDNQKTVQHQKEFNKETMFDIQNTILTPKVSKGDRNSKETRFKEQHEKSKGALDISNFHNLKVQQMIVVNLRERMQAVR